MRKNTGFSTKNNKNFLGSGHRPLHRSLPSTPHHLGAYGASTLMGGGGGEDPRDDEVLL